MTPSDGVGDEFVIAELIRNRGDLSALAQQVKDHMTQSAENVEKLEVLSRDLVAMHLHVRNMDLKLEGIEAQLTAEQAVKRQKAEKRSERRQWLFRDVLVMGLIVGVVVGLITAGILWLLHLP